MSKENKKNPKLPSQRLEVPGHQLGRGLACAPEAAEDKWLVSGGGGAFKRQSFK